MQYLSDKVFHFLEKSPYFYKKEKIIGGQNSGDIIKGDIEHLNYIFFEQQNSDRIIAEISIPVKNPHGEIKWKFIQLNDKVSRPTYQSVNTNLDIMPVWFKSLILEVKHLYENKVFLFRCFSSINKN
ncbi:hypothetical protein AAGG74_14540 [Bacillus mexicanus]|uniref:hypothetical protein n=1 Tax=Bacillus mexicanus TaxID=2834415 RepID=UPI003D2164B4